MEFRAALLHRHAIWQQVVHPLFVGGELSLNDLLKVHTDHLGEPEQKDGDVCEFFAEVALIFAPGIECLGHLAAQQAKFERYVGGIEAL